VLRTGMSRTEATACWASAARDDAIGSLVKVICWNAADSTLDFKPFPSADVSSALAAASAAARCWWMKLFASIWALSSPLTLLGGAARKAWVTTRLVVTNWPPGHRLALLTTSCAPAEAAPEMTLISFPADVCQALIAGFGPAYAASSWPASSAVDSWVPLLNGVSCRLTLLPSSFRKKPSLIPTSAGACVMFARTPSRRVTGVEAAAAAAGVLDEPDEPDELHPAARTVAAAPPATISALFIVRLFSHFRYFRSV